MPTKSDPEQNLEENQNNTQDRSDKMKKADTDAIMPTFSTTNQSHAHLLSHYQYWSDISVKATSWLLIVCIPYDTMLRQSQYHKVEAILYNCTSK